MSVKILPWERRRRTSSIARPGYHLSSSIQEERPADPVHRLIYPDLLGFDNKPKDLDTRSGAVRGKICIRYETLDAPLFETDSNVPVLGSRK